MPLVSSASSYLAKCITEKAESVSPLALGLLVEVDRPLPSWVLLLANQRLSLDWGKARGIGLSIEALQGTVERFFWALETVAALLTKAGWILTKPLPWVGHLPGQDR